jgi:hypothetical protein
MPAGVIILICIALTMAPLTALVAWIYFKIEFENGHYDRLRLEPKPEPWNPEYHGQVRG